MFFIAFVCGVTAITYKKHEGGWLRLLTGIIGISMFIGCSSPASLTDVLLLFYGRLLPTYFGILLIGRGIQLIAEEAKGE